MLLLLQICFCYGMGDTSYLFLDTCILIGSYCAAPDADLFCYVMRDTPCLLLTIIRLMLLYHLTLPEAFLLMQCIITEKHSNQINTL